MTTRTTALEPIDPIRLYTYDEAALYLSTTKLGVKHLVRIGWLDYRAVSENGRLRRISGQAIIDFIQARGASARGA